MPVVEIGKIILAAPNKERGLDDLFYPVARAEIFPPVPFHGLLHGEIVVNDADAASGYPSYRFR